MSYRPMLILSDAALGDMREALLPLREDGWPVEMEIVAASPHEDHVYEVVAKIKIGYGMKIPNESRP